MVAPGAARRARINHWPVPWPVAAARPLVGRYPAVVRGVTSMGPAGDRISPRHRGGRAGRCRARFRGTDRHELAGPLLAGRPGCRPGTYTGATIGPGRDPETSANPPMTGGPGRDHFRAGTKQNPDSTVPGDGLSLNVPTESSPDWPRRDPGRTGTPKEKEKGS